MKPADTRQVKAAFCQHCGNWIRVAAFPWSETNKDCLKRFRDHIKDGNRIEVMLLTEWNAVKRRKMCGCP